MTYATIEPEKWTGTRLQGNDRIQNTIQNRRSYATTTAFSEPRFHRLLIFQHLSLITRFNNSMEPGQIVCMQQ
jgi:hypothetical protein